MSSDRERGSVSEWSRIMREYRLNDVSIDRYREEMKNILVSMGKEFFQEMTTEVVYDWDAIEPVRTDTVKAKKGKTNGLGYTWVERPWDEILDGEGFTTKHKLWATRKLTYETVKSSVWPFIMSTLTEDMKDEMTAHSTFSALQIAGDTLGLYQLLVEVSQGVRVNNVLLLNDKWKAMRYVRGTNVTRFFLNFESLIQQIDHAAGETESKMSDSTKCFQLTIVFSKNDKFDKALGDCTTTLKSEPTYHKYAVIAQRLKNTVQNTQEPGKGSQGTKTGKTGRAQVLGDKPGNKPPGNKGGKPGAQGAKKGGGKFKCFKCNKMGNHYAKDCSSKDAKPFTKCGSDRHCTEAHQDRDSKEWTKVGSKDKKNVK
jgi:hypothetical protein